MSRRLTWEFLSPLLVNRCVASADPQSVRQVLKEAEAESKAGYLTDLTAEQESILLDLFYHVILFAKTNCMTSEKISALVSLVYHTHNDSMNGRATMQTSYAIFESYILSHSVHRPPYSAAVFAVDDVKHVNDYILSTYYRHYKLYFYAFTRRSEANVQTFLLGDVHEVIQPSQPLSKALPLAQWEANQEELQRQEAERLREAEADEAAARAERDRVEAEKNAGPPMSAGLKSQMSVIKGQVAKASDTRIESLEAKVMALEAKLAEANKPSSSGGGKPAAKGAGRK